MHFDLADLRLFIHIAESPSLTQAAKRAHLSLAAVSVRIKALENQLNTRLLYRDSRGVEITPAGQRLLQHARVIMRQVDHLKHDFQEQADGDAGHIRIFANTTAVTEFMPDILARFLAGHPGVTVDLQERLTRDIVRGVLDGTTDLGIVAGPVDAPELQTIHFSTDRLVLVVPNGHPCRTRTRSSWPTRCAIRSSPCMRARPWWRSCATSSSASASACRNASSFTASIPSAGWCRRASASA